MLGVGMEMVLQLDDSVVLHAIPELEKYWAFNIENGDQYSLNDSAFYLLLLFRYPKKVSEGVAEFAANFEIDIDTAEKDCIPLLNEYNWLKFFKGDKHEN